MICWAILPAPHSADYEDLTDSNLPFNKRRGIVCIGSFQHPPNVQAVRYLCQSILPLIDPALLKKHPVRIIGNALNDNVRWFGEGLPHVRMIGWVPSVEPYLERARISGTAAGGSGDKAKADAGPGSRHAVRLHIYWRGGFRITPRESCTSYRIRQRISPRPSRGCSRTSSCGKGFHVAGAHTWRGRIAVTTPADCFKQ